MRNETEISQEQEVIVDNYGNEFFVDKKILEIYYQSRLKEEGK